MPIPVSKLVERAAVLFDTTAKDILGPSRLPEFTRPRFAVAYAARASERSYPDIAHKLRRKCHTSIIHQVRTAEIIRERDADYLAKSDELVAMATDFAEAYRPEPIDAAVYRAIKDDVYAENFRVRGIAQ